MNATAWSILLTGSGYTDPMTVAVCEILGDALELAACYQLLALKGKQFAFVVEGVLPWNLS